MSKIKQYFNDYPSRIEAHETADGLLFFEANDAQNHAKTLGEGKTDVKLYRRGEQESTSTAGQAKTAKKKIETPEPNVAKEGGTNASDDKTSVSENEETKRTPKK